MLCGQLFSYVRRMERAMEAVMEEKERGEMSGMVHGMQREYNGLCARYQREFDAPVSALFSISRQEEQESEMRAPKERNWNEELDMFWTHARRYYDRVRMQAEHGNDLPRYSQFVGTFFLGRSIPVKLTKTALTAGASLDMVRELLRDAGSMNIGSEEEPPERKLALAAEGKKQLSASPREQSARRDDRPTGSANKQSPPMRDTSSDQHPAPPVFTSIERPPLIIPEQSQQESLPVNATGGPAELTLQCLATAGPVSGSVETMDMVEDSRGS